MSDSIIEKINRKFPMPEGELQRLQARRWILKFVKPGGVGVEVGVFRGHFSELICKIAKPRKLYLIDPWTLLGPTFGWGKEYTCFNTLTTEAARDEAFARASRHKDVEVVMIESSYPRCKDQIVEKLDFAYLDAGHQYQSTMNELKHLDAQVSEDGVILGDDWRIDPEHKHYGVFQAVQEFVRDYSWEIIGAGPGAQWAIRRRKP